MKFVAVLNSVKQLLVDDEDYAKVMMHTCYLNSNKSAILICVGDEVD